MNSNPEPTSLQRDIVKVLSHRAANGGHLHHRHCIHNLPPLEQVELRGKTAEWWQLFFGAMPVQITPADWQCEPPLAEANHD